MAGEHNHSDLHTAHVAMRTCVDYSDLLLYSLANLATSQGTNSDCILWILRVYRIDLQLLNYAQRITNICTVLSAPVKLVLYFILYFRSYSNVKIYLLLFFNTSHYNIIYLHIIHGKANKSTSILIQMPFLFWIFSYLSKIYTQSNIHWIYTLTHDTQWRAFSVFIIIMLS